MSFLLGLASASAQVLFLPCQIMKCCHVTLCACSFELRAEMVEDQGRRLAHAVQPAASTFREILIVMLYTLPDFIAIGGGVYALPAEGWLCGAGPRVRTNPVLGSICPFNHVFRLMSPGCFWEVNVPLGFLFAAQATGHVPLHGTHQPVMYGKPNVLILHQIPPGHARLWITPRRSRQSPHIFTGQPCSLASSNKARSSCTCMAHSSRATS